MGLLCVVLLGFGAFSVDLGMSHVSTRQLQTASDAAALAAANVFKKSAGTSCSDILTAGSGAAASAAASIREANRPGSTQLQYSATCVNGSIEITYESQGTTRRYFGGFVGRTTDYTTSRVSRARVAALDAGTGIRPYALCGSQITAVNGTVFKMSLPSSGNTSCPGAANSGNWWTVDCPESAGNNSNAVLADKTLNGCTSDLDIVPNQVTTPARTAAGLRTYLENYCSPRTNDVKACLGANPGGIGGSQVLTAWDTLVDERRRIVFPVFCGAAPSGPCDQSAVVNAGGNNAVYPIQSVFGAMVCGYRFGNDEHPATNVALSGECGGTNNPLNLSTNDSGNTAQMNYLLLRAVDVPNLGSAGSSSCTLGSACDKGRITYLLR